MARQPIITVASPKGGEGKTTLAYELASLFDAVLVDFDWEMGGATGMVGDDPERRSKSAMLACLEKGEGPTPRPLHVAGRPAVVPSDSRLAELRTGAGDHRKSPLSITENPQAPELPEGVGRSLTQGHRQRLRGRAGGNRGQSGRGMGQGLENEPL